MVKLNLNLDPDLDLDRDPDSEKLLNPDPHKMNADPQPCVTALNITEIVYHFFWLRGFRLNDEEEQHHLLPPQAGWPPPGG